jgi:hypothetical protein
MLPCKAVVGLVGSGEWRDAPLTRRLGLALHLAMCRHCRAYVRSLRRIGDAARRLYGTQPVDPERAARVLDAVRGAARHSRDN